jgi:uncharacterized protein YegL
MVGEPLEAVSQGIKLLCMELKTDPMAMETAYLSAISFSSRARQLVPLTDIMLFSLPPLPLGPGTGLGAAFDLLSQCISRDVRKGTSTQKGDWKPLVFLLTDGQPTDNWQDALNRFKAANPSVNIIAAGCGEDADADVLKAVTPSVLMLKSAGPDSFKAFFKWVSQSVSVMSVGIKDGEKFKLPAPPADVLAAPVKPGGSKSPSQIILAARCRDQKKGYLMRYRRSSPSGDIYQAEKAYKVSDDYFSEADATGAGNIRDPSLAGEELDRLQSSIKCPYCDRSGWHLAKDGTLLCGEAPAPVTASIPKVTPTPMPKLRDKTNAETNNNEYDDGSTESPIPDISSTKYSSPHHSSPYARDRSRRIGCWPIFQIPQIFSDPVINAICFWLAIISGILIMLHLFKVFG